MAYNITVFYIMVIDQTIAYQRENECILIVSSNNKLKDFLRLINKRHVNNNYLYLYNDTYISLQLIRY